MLLVLPPAKCPSLCAESRKAFRYRQKHPSDLHFARPRGSTQARLKERVTSYAKSASDLVIWMNISIHQRYPVYALPEVHQSHRAFETGSQVTHERPRTLLK